MKQLPVVNKWQAPETFDDLIDICNRQQIDLMDIFENIFKKIRDGQRHLLLVGFPIPKYFGGETKIIYWKALYLPVVPYGKKTAKGFRNNLKGWWMRDQYEVFTRNKKIEWVTSSSVASK